MNQHCLVCGFDEFNEIFSGLLLKCRNCGFITVPLIKDSCQINNLYNEKYFKGEEYLDYPADRDVHLKNFNKRITFIFKKINPEKIRYVLEIGCAYGFFGEALLKRLPGVDFMGLDVVEEAVNFGRKTLNLNVNKADFLKFESGRKYTDIFMWDVIEHLERPESYLEKIYTELEDNGRLYISTGNIKRLLPCLQGQKWRLIHPPSHLHYFSFKTLNTLLQKKGFDVVSITYPAIYRSTKQIFYSLFMLNKKYSQLTKKLYDLIPSSSFIPINTFDIMMVIGVKKPNTNR